MNRDRRAREPRPYRLRLPSRRESRPAPGAGLDRSEVAPWVIAQVRAWPGTVEDRLVAVRIGVQPRHVRVVREER
jgi:hypothetical protein